MPISSWLGSAWIAPQAAGQHGLDHDLLAQGAAQQIRHAGDEAARIDRLGIERRAAREGEQALGERGRALGAERGMLERAREAVGIGVAAAGALRGLEVAQDHRQQVVEIVRHAAGELADAFHFLRLGELLLGAHQLLLRGAALGDVARDLGKAQQVAVAVVDAIYHHARPEARAVLAHALALGLELAFAPCRLQRLARVCPRRGPLRYRNSRSCDRRSHGHGSP